MNFVPIATADTPRKLIPASPSVRAILAPSPGLSLPSTRTEWMFSGLPKPASCAALTAFAPLTGVTNMTPCPGVSVRRASSISRFAPPLASPSSLSAAPPSRLELMIGDLVPRRTCPVVVLDGGGEGLADKAAARLEGLGYSDISIMEGGCAAWKAAGGELFSGVNVPSKAFGEFVEHH